MAQHVLDHDTFVYLTVTLAPSSPALADPALLTRAHPSLAHLGAVGELRDVQLLSVPKNAWAAAQGPVLAALHGTAGVQRVDVQGAPRTRAKRDEF